MEPGPAEARGRRSTLSEKRRRWRRHPAAEKEFHDLPENGKQGLAELMRRIRSGEDVLPRELENYGKGLWGLKYSEARNEFRCYYGHVAEEGQVLLAVAFDYKKTEKADLSRARDAPSGVGSRTCAPYPRARLETFKCGVSAQTDNV